VDRDLFDQVQQRRNDSHKRHRMTTGSSVRGNYLLTGVARCGVCGGKMAGQTNMNSKSVRTRYYVCGTHHRGDKQACPKRYTVPADRLESHVLDIIREDLARLRDDDQLHVYIAAELQRMSGGQTDTQQNLRQRLRAGEGRTTSGSKHHAAGRGRGYERRYRGFTSQHGKASHGHGRSEHR